jgi:hypothetical protein
MDEFLYRKLVDTVHLFYPAGLLPDDSRYEVSLEKQRLVKQVATSATDIRWQILLDKMNALGEWITAVDLTAYSFFSPCFKASILVRHGDKEYLIGFYISMISEHYVYKVIVKFKEEPGTEERLFSLNEEDRSMYLAEISNAFTQYRLENPACVNACPEDICHLVEQIVSCQDAVFGYEPFPEEAMSITLPDFAINSKNFGEVTFFNFFFTDWEISD